MSITEELNNVRKMESVGFTHDQAETLAGIIEKAQVDGQVNLKDFIRNELNNLRNELLKENNNLRNELLNENSNLRNELISEIKDIEVRMAHAQRDMLIKIFGIVVGTVGIAVTILKLFP